MTNIIDVDLTTRDGLIVFFEQLLGMTVRSVQVVDNELRVTADGMFGDRFITFPLPEVAEEVE